MADSDEIARNREEIKRLATLKEAGQIDPRQTTRLRFLQNKVAKASPQKGAAKGPFAGIQDPTVKQQIKEDASVANYSAGQNLKYGNAGTQQSPFGTQNITTDAQGNSTVTQTLDPAQQAIVDKDASLSNMGREVAQNLFGQFGTQQFNPANFDRKRIEDSYIANQTERLTQDYQKAVAAKKQELYETGNHEGTPRFNAEMGRLDSQYQDQVRAVRNDAVINSGAEATRQFGIDQGTRNQQIGELQGFAGFGTGARLPQFQGFNGTDFKLTAPSALGIANQSADQNQQQLDIAMKKLNQSANQTTTAANPFINSPPPGS